MLLSCLTLAKLEDLTTNFVNQSPINVPLKHVEILQHMFTTHQVADSRRPQDIYHPRESQPQETHRSTADYQDSLQIIITSLYNMNIILRYIQMKFYMIVQFGLCAGTWKWIQIERWQIICIQICRHIYIYMWKRNLNDSTTSVILP